MSDPTTLIFSDTFTEASTDTQLTSHTPDTGTGWTKLLGDANKYMFAQATNDRCEVSADAYGQFGYAISNAANADQAAEAVWKNSDLNNGDPYLCVGLQADGGSDLKYYGVGLHPGTPEFRIYRKVSGVYTQLGTAAAGALDDQIRIKRVGANISVERFSGGSWSTIIGPVDDTASLITGGKPGLAWDLPGSRIVCDSFKAYDDSGGGATKAPPPFRRPYRFMRRAA